MKIPRYMKEYANSIVKTCKHYKKLFNNENGDIWDESIRLVNRALTLFERGLITENEAMQILVNALR